MAKRSSTQVPLLPGDGRARGAAGESGGAVLEARQAVSARDVQLGAARPGKAVCGDALEEGGDGRRESWCSRVGDWRRPRAMCRRPGMTPRDDGHGDDAGVREGSASM